MVDVKDIKIKISGETLKLLLNKMSELEQRVAELESRVTVVNNTVIAK